MQHAKIVGGAEAQTMIPWQVALLSDNFQFCGGTILDSCTILSAAHCGINKAHKIRAGSKNRKKNGQVINNIFYLTSYHSLILCQDINRVSSFSRCLNGTLSTLPS